MSLKSINHNDLRIEKDMYGKNFLTLADFSSSEIEYLISLALTLKKKQKLGIPHEYLKGKTLGMIFEKSSTRTRVSFEVGMYQLGGHASFLSSRDLQLGRGESINDTAKVLSRYLDGVMIRTFDHQTIEEFASASSIPVINGLTNSHHPAQVLADLMTIKEYKGDLKGVKLCFIGDGNNNMTHSLIEGAALTGMNISVASPKNYEPNQSILNQAIQIATTNDCHITLTNDPEEAIDQADVVITDVWASMGQEDEQTERMEQLAPYQINQALCEKAKPNYIFLHCLPAHRGEEVTAEIIDGKHSVVFDEAENRLHAQKALLKVLLSD